MLSNGMYRLGLVTAGSLHAAYRTKFFATCGAFLAQCEKGRWGRFCYRLALVLVFFCWLVFLFVFCLYVAVFLQFLWLCLLTDFFMDCCDLLKFMVIHK